MIRFGRYQEFKAIFLEIITEGIQDESSGIEESCFQNVVAAGREAGVAVYSLSKHEGMRQLIDFVEAPDGSDLESGIHVDGRPSGCGFDPYMSRRIPPDSKTARYNALWQSLKARREANWVAQNEVRAK